jgi:hypothetical protein
MIVKKVHNRYIIGQYQSKHDLEYVRNAVSYEEWPDDDYSQDMLLC